MHSSENTNNSLQMSVETVTPMIASEYLKHNTQNRRTSAGHVKILAADMAAGSWETNGDAIRFDVSGRLIDGQHRLHAVIKSGATIVTVVIRNLPEESFSTIDANKIRGGADTLSVLHVDNSKTVAAALRLVRASAGLSTEWNGWPDRLVDGTKKITNKQFIELNDQYPLVRVAADRMHRGDRKYCRKLLTASGATFAFYWMSQIDDDDAEQFFEWLEVCENITRNHPVSMLRNKLIDNMSNNAHGTKVTKRLALALTFRSWNAVRDGENLKLLKWSQTGHFPIPH